MASCPNINHPDWKALVDKVGTREAFRIYIENNETIPNITNLDLVKYDLAKQYKSDFLLNGFKTVRAQIEAVNTVASAVLSQMLQRVEVSTALQAEAGTFTRPKTFSEAFNTIRDQIKELIDSKTNPKFIPVYENIQEIRNLVEDKLDELGLIRRTTEDDVIEGVEYLESGKVDLNYWKDDWVLSFDSKKNALQAVKQFLAFVPKTIFDSKTGKYKEVSSSLSVLNDDGSVQHYPEYLSYDEVYDTLHGLLAGTTNTWEEMEKVMLANQQAKPFIYNILQQIKTYKADKQQLINQFVSTMSSVSASGEGIIWSERKGEYSIKAVDSDQLTTQKQITRSWNIDFTKSNLLKEDKNGNLIPNKDKIKEVLDKISKERKEYGISGAEDILNDLGINISKGTKDELEKRLKREFESNFGLFSILSNKLKAIQDIEISPESSEEELTQEYSPIIDNSAITRLARDEARYGEYIFTNSYINGQGNSVQSYIPNNTLTLEFRKLFRDSGYVNSLLKLGFSKVILDEHEKVLYNNWLYEIKNNPIFKEVFKITPFDTIRRQRGGEAIKLSEMSPLDLEVTKLSLFQNSGDTRRGANTGEGRIMKFLFTVPSKTVAYTITVPALDINISKSGENSKTIKNAIYSIAASEMNRIYSSQLRNNKYSNPEYRKGAKQFYFFPSLNNLPIFNADGSLLLPTTTVENKTVEQHIKDELQRILSEEIDNTKEYWKTLGIIQTNKNNEDYLAISDKSYLKKFTTKNNREQIRYAVTDYVVNGWLAKFNLHQSVIGDPALFYKSSINETWENINKRLAGIIAPIHELALDHVNEKFIYITAKDNELAALNIQELRDILGDKVAPYEKINGTDAQELVTLREELGVRYKRGQISTAVYNNLITRYNKEGNNLVLTKEELDFLFSSSKPKYFFTHINEEEDVAYKEYVKSSSFPLIPQITKGTELDKIRIKLEELEKKTNLPVRLAFKSAIKVGGKTALNIFDSTTNKVVDNLEITEDNYTEVYREGFGIQQEQPDTDSDEITKSTQATKHMLDSALELDNFELEGEKLTGYQIKDKYLELHDQLYKTALDNLHKQIIRSDNKTLHTRNLFNLLNKEAVKRGYSTPELATLSLDNFDNFKHKFWASTISYKLEPLLTSLYTNNIIRQKMNGRSYILVSEEGWNGKSEGIVYTKKYDPNTGLKPSRLVYRKNNSVLEYNEYQNLSDKSGYVEEVAPGQILIPWNFKDQNGTLLDLKKFTNPDGTLDLSKVSPSILRQVGFRIPNQGDSSMSLLEVVGFLPNITTDVVVASRNLVAQMGSDFDRDVLYIYQYDYFKSKSGNLRRKKDNIRNSILDIHKTVLEHPSVFRSVASPLSLGRLSYKTKSGKKGTGVIIKNYYTNDNKFSYLSPTRDNQKYKQSVDGKRMLAISAITSTFSSLYYQTEEEIQSVNKDGSLTSFVIGIEDNKGEVTTKKLSTISGNTTVDGEKKTENNSILISAAADEEKDPLLAYINLVPETSDVLVYMQHLGIDVDTYIPAFLAQPSLVEFSNIKRARNGSLRTDSTYRTDYEILDELITKYRRLAKEENNGRDIPIDKENLGNYPLTFEELMSTFTNKTLKPTRFGESTLSMTPNQLQVLVLLKYLKAKPKAEFLTNTQVALNIESGGVGPRLLEVADKVSRIEQFMNSNEFTNIQSIITNDEGAKGLLFFPISYGLFSANEVLNGSGLFPYSNDRVREVFQAIMDLNSNRRYSIKDKIAIWEGIKSYIFSSIDYGFNRQDLFFDSKDNKSLATEVEELKRTRYATNPFLIRLNTEIDRTGKRPSKVYYPATKQEPIDADNTYKGFIELLINPETNNIARKLVAYFFINGGNQKAREFGKLIDPNYLEFSGITEQINNYRFNDDNLTRFTRQYLQHNPRILPQYTLPEDTKESNTITLPNPSSSEAVTNLILDTDYVPYFSVRNFSSRKGYSIYQRLGRDKDGNTVFTRISVLGDQFYNEYQYATEFAKSLVKVSNQTEEEVSNFNHYVSPKEDKKTITNPTKYSIGNLVNSGNIVEALTLIANNSNDNTLKILANYLAQYAKDLPEVKIVENKELVGSGRQYKASDGNGIIEYNLNNLQNPSNIDEVERLIIHESIHGIIFNIFQRNGAAPTSEQKQALDRLNTLYTSLKARVLAGELEEFGLKAEELNRFNYVYNKWLAKEQLTEEEQNDLSRLARRYYPLSNRNESSDPYNNLEEFITHFLTQPEFQDILNNIKYDSKKSILDRIAELISKIVSALTINKNGKQIKVAEDSVLYSAIVDSLDIFSENNKGKSGSTFETIQDINDKYSLNARNIDKESEKNYNSIINSFKTRAILLSQAIATAYTTKDNVRAKELEKRRDDLKRELEEILENTTLETIFKQGNNDLERAETILNRDSLSPNDINYVRSVWNLWLKAPELLIDTDETKEKTNNYKLATQLRDKANELKDRWNIIFSKEFIDLANKSTGSNISEEQLYTQEKTNVLATSLLDLSKSENMLQQVAGEWMRTAAYNTTLEFNEINKEIEKLDEELKKTQEYKNEGFFLFARKDKNGNYTDKLVAPLNDEYYSTRDKLISYAREETNPKARASKWRRYFSWVRENHTIIDNRELFTQREDGTYEYKDNPKYLSQLKESLGEDTDRLVEDVKERVENYNDQLLAKIQATADEPNQIQEVEEWKLANDPNIHIQNILEGYIERKVGGKIIVNSGWKYTIRRANKNWEDESYKTIKANLALKQYYDYISNTLKTLYSYVPDYYINEEFDNYTIPNINKSFADRFNEDGVRAAFKGLPKDMLRSMTVTNAELEGEKIIDPATDELVRTLKVLYLNKLEGDKISYDLTKVLRAFALQALNFKHKSKVTDSLKMAEFAFDQALELQRRPDGYPKKDKFGNEVKTKSLDNTAKQFKYALDAFFGDRKKVQGVIKSKAIAKEGKADLIKKIDEALLELENKDTLEQFADDKDLKFLADGDITKDEKVKLLDELKSRNLRYISLSRVGDSILKYFQIKAMGWNPFSALNNLIVGYLSNANWAAGGVDFDLSELKSAQGLMFRSISDKHLRNKIDELMLKFDTVKEINEAAYESTTDSNTLRKGIRKLAPLTLHKIGERWVQGQTMIAMMLHKKVAIEDGREISLWEAFDNNGKWNSEKYGKNLEWQGDYNTETITDGHKFKFKLDQVLKAIHGNYDPNSPVLIKQGLGGRALIQFRSWIGETFEQRFGGEKYDLLLNRKRKGRYRSYGDLGVKGSFKTLVNQLFSGERAFENLRDVEGKIITGEALNILKENMKRNLAEVIQLLAITAVFLMLKGIKLDDEDDEEQIARNTGLNLTLRLLDETMFYFNPTSFENISRSAVPVTQLIQDSYRFLDAVGYAAIGEDTISTGIKAGESRLLWRGAKLFPLGASITTTLNKGKVVESFR